MSTISSDNFNLSERGRLRYEAFLQLQANEGRQRVPSSESEPESESEMARAAQDQAQGQAEVQARAQAHAQAQAQALAQSLANKFPKSLHAPDKILPKLTQFTHIRDIFKKNGKLVRSVSLPGRSDSSNSLSSPSTPASASVSASASTSDSTFVSATNLPGTSYSTDLDTTEGTGPHQKRIVRRRTTQSIRCKSSSKDRIDEVDTKQPSVSSKRRKKNSSTRRSRSRKTASTPHNKQATPETRQSSRYSEETHSYAMTIFLQSLCSRADNVIESSVPSLRPYRKHVKITLIITALVVCHYTIDLFILLLSMHVQ
ncbi:hypothetical protein C6P41_002352 [Kluyveromyces marxianus]|nr:hypothetical protein C6P41_002352 [Kluyveromyces marxianus]